LLNIKRDICKAIGQKTSQFGVGKVLRKFVWLHKSALISLNLISKEAILDALPSSFRYRYNKLVKPKSGNHFAVYPVYKL
jgi:hypothetical protein